MSNLFRGAIFLKSEPLGSFGSVDVSAYRAIRVFHNFNRNSTVDYVYQHTYDFLLLDIDDVLCLSSLYSLGNMYRGTDQSRYYINLVIRNGILTPNWLTDISGQSDDLLSIWGIY